MEYAHKVSKLVIGKNYLVAHAILKMGYFKETIISIPINPLKHNDNQFSDVGSHYHIDGRFPVRVANKHDFNVDKFGRTNIIITSDSEYCRYEIKDIRYYKRKCIRLTTGLKPPDTADKYNDWYKSMIGKSCAGKRCPHYGATMIEVNGKLFCPLHNLHGNIKTMKIVEPY